MRSPKSSGTVFDVSRCCVDDGPGVRTVVFLKGCPLDCPWCHNPEGKRAKPEIALDASSCIGCDACKNTCIRTWPKPDAGGWRSGCTACGACAEGCPAGARQVVGRRVEVAELVSEVMADAAFFAGTGGGVTLSGGEPVAQPGFLFDCAAELSRRGVHVAVETSGLWPAAMTEDLRRHTDLVLFDVKHTDPTKFASVLGPGLDRILKNLGALVRAQVRLELRLTLVPGFNDRPEDLEHITRTLIELECRAPVRVQPFHRLASSKQTRLGRDYAFGEHPPPAEATLAAAVQRLTAAGFEAEL